jgi:hypothetical protein
MDADAAKFKALSTPTKLTGLALASFYFSGAEASGEVQLKFKVWSAYIPFQRRASSHNGDATGFR